MQLKFLPLVIAGAILVALFVVLRAPMEHVPASSQRAVVLYPLDVGDIRLQVELARDPAAWQKGLSGRETLPDDRGMLFQFPERQVHIFWMKDTRIPLDILWIRDGQVVGIAERAMPEPGVSDLTLQKYISQEPVDEVLEVNGGWAASHDVTVGTRVKLLSQ